MKRTATFAYIGAGLSGLYWLGYCFIVGFSMAPDWVREFAPHR